METKDFKKTKGMTLISLVVSIVVLLILAGVSIVTLSGENGILTQAQNAVEKTKIAEEQANLMLADKMIEVMSNVSGEHGEIGIASILSELKTEGYIENYGTTGETTITGITLDENEISIAIGGQQELTASFTSSSTTGDYYVVIEGKKYPVKKENNKIVIEKNEIPTNGNATTEISDVQTSDGNVATVEKTDKDKVKITGVARGATTITVKYTETIKTTLTVNVKGNVAITLQSNNDSYGTVEKTVNGSYLEGTQIILSDELVTPGSEYKFDGWYINNDKITLETGNKYTVPADGTTSVTIIAKFIEKPQTFDTSASAAGYYADLNNDGVIDEDNDGIIFVDLAKTQKSTSGLGVSYSYTPITSDLKNYVTGTTTYKNATVNYLKLEDNSVGSSTLKDRFYVLGLKNITEGTNNALYWYFSAYNTGMSDFDSSGSITGFTGKGNPTSTAFGAGKLNTETMINKWYNNNSETGNGTYGAKNDRDMWRWVKQKRDEVTNSSATNKPEWFVPSKEEWAAVYGELISSYYYAFGLSQHYWSSSQNSTNSAWYAWFYNGDCRYYDVNRSSYVRLVATF